MQMSHAARSYILSLHSIFLCIGMNWHRHCIFPGKGYNPGACPSVVTGYRLRIHSSLIDTGKYDIVPAMKALITFSSITALALAPSLFGASPEHFSEAAKMRLADSIELEQPAYKLNVVYFTGNDNEPIADYQRRISELLLYLQQFYAKEMDRNGYGKRAFGLSMLPNGEVDIILIRGKKGHKEYSYGTGHNACLEEVNAYFAENPDKKLSHHTFVIMPTHYDEQYGNANPGGVPFYGLGRNCFALDYPDFDIKYLGQDTPKGRLLTKWYGGFAHELGHGLNLPHNDGPTSMNQEFGTPLMGSGNYTFGLKPTYLTPSTCSILNYSETFAVAGKAPQFYPEQPAEPTVKDLRIIFDGENLNVSLKCEEKFCVNAYIQDPGYQVNQDYDAIAFRMQDGATNDGLNCKTATMPLKELTRLKNVRNGEQAVDLLFGAPDGSRFRTRIIFNWEVLKTGDSIPTGELQFRQGY